LIDRAGKIKYVIAGSASEIVIPDISQYRVAPDRLRGLRCVHTHLAREPLTKDDLSDLALLRLDMMAAVTMSDDGRPDQIHAGHIIPENEGRAPYRMLQPLPPHGMDIGFLKMIRAIESELSRSRILRQSGQKTDRALIINATFAPKESVETSLDELTELAATSGIEVADRIIQRRKKMDPKFVMGLGKLQEAAITALSKGASLIIFDQELSPSQVRSIADVIELKVIDRTQLILDIFAQRAKSREGKIQVELAQLQYLLPRLATKNRAMSRLTGGIGARGPGETKLEINRRRAREKIQRLQKDLSKVKKQRRQQKAKRKKNELPTISIVGYTNAGKSTLLNSLTKSDVMVENKLFATLDPSSRRLKLPRDTNVIITDTVGFIRDLPKELAKAFRSTLEEVESADILLHVIDISNPRYEEQMESVEKILLDFNLNPSLSIRVLNKQDKINEKRLWEIQRKLSGIPISAWDASTLSPLVSKMETELIKIKETNEYSSDKR